MPIATFRDGFAAMLPSGGMAVLFWTRRYAGKISSSTDPPKFMLQLFERCSKSSTPRQALLGGAHRTDDPRLKSYRSIKASHLTGRLRNTEERP